jgi:ABC-type dipeptide/oligopeptide/nickel transport system ATPase component
MSEALLRLSISVGYPGHPNVLRGVELEVGEGEIVGLASQSGSGKSTIALSILRLLGHHGGMIAGSVDFRGRNLPGPERTRDAPHPWPGDHLRAAKRGGKPMPLDADRNFARSGSGTQGPREECGYRYSRLTSRPATGVWYDARDT